MTSTEYDQWQIDYQKRKEEYMRSHRRMRDRSFGEVVDAHVGEVDFFKSIGFYVIKFPCDHPPAA
jgi:hypothetical protein